MTEAVAAAATEEAKTELTLDEKIANLEARLEKLRQQKLTESLLENIEKGDKVTIKFGRADKVREIEGEVVGVKLPHVVVLDDEAETYKVHVRDVLSNPAAAERAGRPEPVVRPDEIDPVTGRRPEEAGGDDGGVIEDVAAGDPLDQA